MRNDCTEGEEPGCRWSGELSLDDAARAWSCQEAKDQCGQEVVGGGDVNGDGHPDLLVDVLQTPGSDPHSGGGVWWLPGWSAASGDIGGSGIRLWSPNNQRRWYSSQAFLPDLDGDGYDEILIGSVQGGNAVYLFFGPLTADRVWTDADIWIDQAEVGNFGVVLAADHQMMAISASGAVYTELGWSEDLGQVYLFDDPLAGPFAVADATATLTPSPTLSGMLLGAALCLSDLDGDGVDEVIAGGAASYDWAASLGQLRGGAVYILKGPVEGDLRLDDEDNALVDATSRIQSIESGGNFGARLSCAGDVDGDGLPDLAVAAAGTGLTDSLPGTVALFPGHIAPGVQSVNDAPFLFYGAVTPGYLGYSLTSDSDLDGDGFHDLAFTAAVEGDSLRAGVFFGPLGGTALDTDADALLHDEVGFYISGGFDLDQDGFDDLIIDSPYDDTLGTSAGTVYLMRGEGP